jgi:GxxExxY protein
VKLDSQELPHILVSACMEVHRHLGPFLPSFAYQECLAAELKAREIFYTRQQPISLTYKGHTVPDVFTFDFVVENLVALDVQTYDENDRAQTDQHKSRLSQMLRLSGLSQGLLVNFHAADFRHGLKRLIISPEATSQPTAQKKSAPSPL